MIAALSESVFSTVGVVRGGTLAGMAGSVSCVYESCFMEGIPITDVVSEVWSHRSGQFEFSITGVVVGRTRAGLGRSVSSPDKP